MSLYNSRLIDKAYQVLPPWLRMRLFPAIEPIRAAVRKFAAETPVGAVVVDAGAGETPYRDFFSHAEYVAFDSADGDSLWDYSRLSFINRLDQIALRDSTADRALLTLVLEHVPEPQRVMDEVFRILKPGGKLLAAVPQGGIEHQEPNDFFRFTRFAMSMLAEKSGYSGIDIHPMGGYFAYLGDRMASVRNIVLQRMRGKLATAILWPPYMILLAMLAMNLFLLHFLDPLDKEKKLTLGYICVFEKQTLGE